MGNSLDVPPTSNINEDGVRDVMNDMGMILYILTKLDYNIRLRFMKLNLILLMVNYFNSGRVNTIMNVIKKRV